MALIYIGKGKHITGIPAHDLDDETLKHLPFSESELIASRLYKAKSKPKASKVSIVKDEE